MSRSDDRWLPWRPSMQFPFLDEDFWSVDVPRSPSGLTVSEDREHVHIEAYLPGLKPENIEVIFEKGELWIHGQKKEEEEDKQKKFYRKASSSFSYRLRVPGMIDDKKEPKAVYKDGVMKVSFAKVSQAPSLKKIQIKTE